MVAFAVPRTNALGGGIRSLRNNMPNAVAVKTAPAKEIAFVMVWMGSYRDHLVPLVGIGYHKGRLVRAHGRADTERGSEPVTIEPITIRDALVWLGCESRYHEDYDDCTRDEAAHAKFFLQAANCV